MDAERQYADKLIHWLYRAGLAEFAAVVLEAAGPLAGLGAQAIFMIEPLVSSPGGELRELAVALEDPEQVEQLVERLRSQRGAM